MLKSSFLFIEHKEKNRAMSKQAKQTEENPKERKHTIQYLKYRDIALDFVKSGYTNIREIYKKYYPGSSEATLSCNPYRLLEDARFKEVLNDVWLDFRLDDVQIAKEVISCLRKEMFNAEKSSDRTNAASWLGRSEALFKDRFEGKIETVSKEEQAEIETIQKRYSLS